MLGFARPRAAAADDADVLPLRFVFRRRCFALLILSLPLLL
jgi:hypothetical protein